MYSMDLPDDFSALRMGASSVIKRFNFCKLNEELKILADGVSKGDTDLLEQRLLNKRIPMEITKNIKDIRAGKSQRRLD